MASERVGQGSSDACLPTMDATCGTSNSLRVEKDIMFIRFVAVFSRTYSVQRVVSAGTDAVVYIVMEEFEACIGVLQAQGAEGVQTGMASPWGDEREGMWANVLEGD